MKPSIRGIAMEAEAATHIVDVSVTAAYGSGGQAVADASDSISVLMLNTGAWPIEYQVIAIGGSPTSAWRRLIASSDVTLAISLAAQSLLVRKAEFSGPCSVQLAIEMITGNVLGEGADVPLLSKDTIGLDQVQNIPPTLMPVSEDQAAAIELARDRSQQTNLMPAAAAEFPDGKLLTIWRSETESTIAQLSNLVQQLQVTPPVSSDPVVTAPPVLSGTVGVGNNLTLTAGPVTDGAGGSSALDFGAGSATNTTRRLTTSVLTALNDTTGWAVGCWIRFGTFAGNSVFMGFGTAGAASSFQLCTFSATQIGVQVRDASGANTDARISYPAAGTYLVVGQYSDADGSLRLYVVPKGGTVSASSDSTGIALATVTPGSGWYIGSDGTNYTKIPLGECFVVNRRLTNGELTTLAAGAPISSVLAPQLYWPLRTGAAATELNLGSVSNADATFAGTGYTTTTTFFPTNGHKNVFTFRFTDKFGVISDVFNETKVGTTSVLPQTVAFQDGYMQGFHQPIDAITQRPGNTLPSNVVGPILGVAPTNSGGANLPTITQTGSVASGTTINLNAGTWVGAATYVYYLFLNGSTAPFYTSAKKAGADTFVLTDSQVGAVTLKVQAFSALDVASTLAAASAGITVTGAAPVVTVNSALAWPAHGYVDTALTLTEGTYKLNGVVTAPDVVGGVPQILHDFWVVGATTPFRTGNTGPTFTPRSSEGMAVGVQIFVQSWVYYGGVRYGPFNSANLTLEATQAALAIAPSAAAQAGLSLTVGQAVSGLVLGSITGGTTPYSVVLSGSTTPALPATLAASVVSGTPATVQLNGTPNATRAVGPVTVTVTDSATPTPAQVTMTVNVGVAAQQSVTPLAEVTFQWTDLTNGGSITNINDPLGSGLQVQRRSIVNSNYPNDLLVRAESGKDSMLPNSVECWFAFAMSFDPTFPPPASTQDDETVIQQTHFQGNGATQPPIALMCHRQGERLRWVRSWNTKDPSTWQYNGGQNLDTEGTFQLHTEAPPAPGVRYFYIVRMRPGYTTGQGPITQIWRSKNGAAYENIVPVNTGFNDYNAGSTGAGPQSLREGPYKYNGSKWNSNRVDFITTPMAFGQGTNLMANAIAHNQRFGGPAS